MSLIKSKKRFFKIFIFISIFFLILFGFFSYHNFQIKSSIKNLLNANFNLKNTGCVIRTLGENTETVSANFSFYTPYGQLIKSYERAWQGWELKIECIILPLKNGSIVFPYRVFSNRSKYGKGKYGTGIVLFNYYTKHNFPAIYDYSFLSEQEKLAIKKLFHSVKFSPYLFKIFSNAKVQTITLREFKLDREYLLLVDANKKIYFRQNY